MAIFKECKSKFFLARNKRSPKGRVTKNSSPSISVCNLLKKFEVEKIPIAKVGWFLTEAIFFSLPLFLG